MASRSIQLSVMQVTFGILLGSTIEALLPGRVEGASLLQQVFEVLVQTGLNGAALSIAADLIRSEGIDPTSGFPFSMALWASQLELRKRIELLSAQVKAMVLRSSLQMARPATKAVKAS